MASNRSTGNRSTDSFLPRHTTICVRVLGIDPGTVVTGWGVVEWDGRAPEYVASGVLAVGRGDLAPRLAAVYDGIRDVIVRFSPQVLSLERNFLAAEAIPTRGGTVEQVDDVEQRGLAAAGGTHHRDELALTDLDVDVAKRLMADVVEIGSSEFAASTDRR